MEVSIKEKKGMILLMLLQEYSSSFNVRVTSIPNGRSDKKIYYEI